MISINLSLWEGIQHPIPHLVLRMRMNVFICMSLIFVVVILNILNIKKPKWESCVPKLLANYFYLVHFYYLRYKNWILFLLRPADLYEIFKKVRTNSEYITLNTLMGYIRNWDEWLLWDYYDREITYNSINVVFQSGQNYPLENHFCFSACYWFYSYIWIKP